MLSKVSLDEVCMHYFEKMSSASGAKPPDPMGALPLDPAGRPPPHCHPLWKKSCGRSCMWGHFATSAVSKLPVSTGTRRSGYM